MQKNSSLYRDAFFSNVNALMFLQKHLWSMRIAVLHSIGMCFTGQSKKIIWFPLFAYPKKYPNSNWILPHRRLDSSNEITCSQVYLKSIYLALKLKNSLGKYD